MSLVSNCLGDNCNTQVGANDKDVALNVLDNLSFGEVSVPSSPADSASNTKAITGSAVAAASADVSNRNSAAAQSGNVLFNVTAPRKEWACLKEDSACVRVLAPALSSRPHFASGSECASVCFKQ